MNKLDNQKNLFEKALVRLDEILKEPKNEIVRDSAIKRFEFTLDLSWKLVKTCLEETHGVIVASPKEAVRQAYKQGLIDYDEKWLEMIDDRNEIVHMYKEELAEKLYTKLKDYLHLFNKLLENITKN